MAAPKTETPSLRAPLPFQPKPLQRDRMPLFRENKVPRYLFRVNTPNTAGITTLDHVIPSASSYGSPSKLQDLFSIPPRKAAEILNEHLWWMSHHERDCNLISWTSSLLFALHYGLHRHRCKYNASKLSKISLLILDTTKLPEGTFINEMEIIEVFVGYADTMQHPKKNLKALHEIRTGPGDRYYGEYLSQGDLDIQGKCAQTTIERIIDLGLFNLYPELGDKEEWKYLPTRVDNLRWSFHLSTDITPTTEVEVGKAIALGKVCLGGRWALPVAAMLLALKRHKDGDPVIVQGLADVFSRKEIREQLLRDPQIYGKPMPEGEQFQVIITKIDSHLTSRRINQLADSVASLSIGK
ncbi:hypothetical protein BGZ63DRAFT_462874 [Mariannaea sp. PMI_226]|nr:hypothetical protein BGZ63DRAFT_462874 [Mariannaea sp. PMI_226]